ncbi:hypothetical protein [[Eubacterium] cellulosolvens]
MVGPLWFIGFDSLMEFVAFIIALAVAYQAFKGYRLTKQRTLLYVHFSFALLSTGLLIDSLAGFLGILARTLRGVVAVTLVGYSIYFLAQVLAYGILIFAYVSQTRTMTVASLSFWITPLLGSATPQAAQGLPIKLLGPLVEYHPLSEIVLLFLVFYITVQTGLNYSATKDRNALLVFLGFLLLALSHLFFILMRFGAVLFVVGHVLQLVGFVSLLAMLLRVTRTK